jgi:delta-aminolevulinic acid dehydratase/porphobilinogen synthase
MMPGRSQEAQLDINDDVSSMCYVEVRNALIDEVHSRDGRDIAGIQALTDDELVADAIRLLREGALPREENTR